MHQIPFRTNPFYILHASLTDTPQALRKKADAVILLEGNEEAQNALAVLLHPQKRLYAELSWFPGMDPAEIDSLLTYTDHGGLLPDFSVSSSLAMLNGCRCILTGWPCEYAEGIAGTGLCLAAALSELSVMQTLEELNLAREKSGFPPILSYETIEAQIQLLREEILSDYYQQIRKAPQKESRKAADRLADAYSGSDPMYRKNHYIEKMINAYQFSVSDKEEKLLDRIRSTICTSSPFPDSLIQDIKEWAMITSPRRKLKKAQGMEDKDEIKLYYDLKKYLYAILSQKNYQEGSALLDTMLFVFDGLSEDRIGELRKLNELFPKALRK